MLPVNKNDGTRRDTVRVMLAAQPCVFIVVLTAHCRLGELWQVIVCLARKSSLYQ